MFFPFMVPQESIIAARYWRIRRTAAGNLWDLQGNASNGIWESSDKSGTNLASGLTYSGGISFRNSGGSVSTLGGSYQTNILDSSSGRLTAANGNDDTALRLDFGSDKIIGSIRYSVLSSNPERQPPDMELEYSHDDSVWTAYATLTSTLTFVNVSWTDIMLGATVASVDV